MTENKSKEIREREIIDAAFHCFSKNGIVKTSVDDIAAEAGLTKGGVYWYFKDKKELYISMVERHIQEDIDTLKKFVEHWDFNLESFIELGIHYLDYSVADKSHLFMHAELFSESFKDDVLKKKLKRFHEEYRSMIKAFLNKLFKEHSVDKDDSDITTMACTIMACLEGLQHQCWFGGDDTDDAPYKKAWEQFVTVFLGGLTE
jgi:AcrR family transcriptional regulator